MKRESIIVFNIFVLGVLACNLIAAIYFQNHWLFGIAMASTIIAGLYGDTSIRTITSLTRQVSELQAELRDKDNQKSDERSYQIQRDKDLEEMRQGLERMAHQVTKLAECLNKEISLELDVARDDPAKQAMKDTILGLQGQMGAIITLTGDILKDVTHCGMCDKREFIDVLDRVIEQTRHHIESVRCELLSLTIRPFAHFEASQTSTTSEG